MGFVMEHERLTYPEALRYLAKRYNIEVVEKEESAEEIIARQKKESLYLVLDFARKFYADNLKTGEGRDLGYAYFKSRHLEDETIEKFSLGWAPKGPTALIDAARAAGYKLEYLLEASLAKKKENGEIVDKFRSRAVFPIFSVTGRVIAFSCRTLSSEKNIPKYLNSDETEVYKKRLELYGLYQAKNDMHKADDCILVEGNVDMVMMHQLGLGNVVASCGTALTTEQIRLIKRYTSNVTIMYDGDGAGIKAALKGLELVLKEGMSVKIVLLPDGHDPDSFCRSHTLEEVKGFIANEAKDFINFKTDLLLSDAASDPFKKATLINDIADTISVIPDAVLRSTSVEAVAERFGIESSIIFDRITRTRGKYLEDLAKEEFRRKEQAEAPAGYVDSLADPGEPMPVEYSEPAEAPGINTTMAPAEEDILRFVLGYGCDLMDFESDSAYYSGNENDKPSVTDFIRGAIADESAFVNQGYGKVYAEYLSLYDDGMEQEKIVKSLLDSSDREVADIVAKLMTRQYELSVSAFERALTATSQWLVLQVPKAILVFQERRIQNRINELRNIIATSDVAGQETAMKELVKLQNVQRKLKQKTGREKRYD